MGGLIIGCPKGTPGGNAGEGVMPAIIGGARTIPGMLPGGIIKPCAAFAPIAPTPCTPATPGSGMPIETEATLGGMPIPCIAAKPGKPAAIAPPVEGIVP